MYKDSFNYYLSKKGISEIISYNGLTVKRNFPNLQQVLNKYKDAIIAHENSPIKITPNQTYTNNLNIGFGKNAKPYEVIWDIGIAKKIIKKYNPTLSSLPLQKIIHNVKVRNRDINENYLSKAAQNDTPIICVGYEPTGDIVIIDGNHRVVGKYRNGEQFISAYILKPKLHLKAMSSELFKILYKVHFNICVIGAFMAGKTTLTKAEELLYEV